MTEWLHILRCPISHEALLLIDEQEMLCLKQQGAIIGIEAFENLLRNESGRYYYPVINGIPVLLAEAAFDKNSNTSYNAGLSAEKKKVQDFYDAQGWVSSAEGDYEDAIIYEDLREVSSDYILACHKRVSRHLPVSGTYLLDAASGAVQFDIYLSYSENFTYRICVDFSLRALQEAKKKLGARGIYILCDITNLPFQDAVIDGFVSLNTIYHIPKDEQVKAIHELHRSLVLGGQGVVVYDWFKHSPWMNFMLLPFRGFVYMKNKVVRTFNKLSGEKKSQGRLYFFAHRLAYFREHLPTFQLFVWRTVSVPFMKYYVHRILFGKAFLDWLYQYEERHPESCGKNGEYPMMVFKKNN